MRSISFGKLNAGSFYLLATLSIILIPASKVNAQTTTQRIYWGAYIDGGTYAFDNPPWDMRAVTAFEGHAGKKISILHWGLPWYNSKRWPNGYYPLISSLFETVRLHGSIPFVDWGSWDLSLAGTISQPQFNLSAIISGQHDQYITSWA